MPNKKTIIFDYFVIFLGNLIYALAVVLFNRPAEIPLGGVSGISMIINFLTGLPIGVMTIIINIPLFLMSFKTMGKRFLIRTLFAVVMSSVLIDVLSNVLSGIMVTTQPMLAALYGGVLSGVGLGMVFSRGATTGGSDIISKMLNKRHQHISVGRYNLIINVIVIVIAAAVYRRPEAALYAMIAQFVSATVLDSIVSGADHASAVLIVTKDPQKMSESILEIMHRGCTGLQSKGMYTQQEHTTLLVAVRNHEVAFLKTIVTKTDPTSFIIMLNAREVLGHGFKSYGQ